MIPVEPKDEPRPAFQERVRGPGAAWLATSGLDMDLPVPKGTQVPAYWRACLDELHAAYGGVCAYLCVFIERITGGGLDSEPYLRYLRGKYPLAV